MAGLDPWAFSPRTCSVGIHVFAHSAAVAVDARIKFGLRLRRAGVPSIGPAAAVAAPKARAARRAQIFEAIEDRRSWNRPSPHNSPPPARPYPDRPRRSTGASPVWPQRRSSARHFNRLRPASGGGRSRHASPSSRNGSRVASPSSCTLCCDTAPSSTRPSQRQPDRRSNRAPERSDARGREQMTAPIL
jgi:hypothetical protein